MGRPKADLAAYSPWGSYPVPKPTFPSPLWLPIVPAEGVQTWSDLAVWALGQPQWQAQVSLFTNFYQPDSLSTIASFAAPVAAGLAAQSLPAPVRGGLNACGRANWSWPGVVFTAGGAGLPVLIWGYFVSCVSPFTGLPQVLWAQRLPTSWGFTAGGQSLPIPLAMSFGMC